MIQTTLNKTQAYGIVFFGAAIASGFALADTNNFFASIICGSIIIMIMLPIVHAYTTENKRYKNV